MSKKKTGASSMSTLSVSGETQRIQETQSPHDNTMTQEPKVVSDASRSRLQEAIEKPESQLAWDNDVRFQISRHLIHLRHFRRMSQETLARESNTSQSAIARIESGEENFTQTTLERLVKALRGRFLVSIPPDEFPVLRQPEWWLDRAEPAAHSLNRPWVLVGLAIRQTDEADQMVAALQRMRADTSPAAEEFLLAEAAE